MATLQPYDPAATCRKCGGDDIWTCFAKGCGGLCDQHPDVMQRACRRCSYQWDEAPLDARTRAEGNSE